MSPLKSRLRRATVAATVAAGVGLLGTSVSGMAAMDSDLERAVDRSAPLRLEEERTPGRERDCPPRRCDHLPLTEV